MTTLKAKKIREIQMASAYAKMISLVILLKISVIEFVRILIMLKYPLDQHKHLVIVIQDTNGTKEE